MHAQLETTRIHIATSERPMYTSLSPLWSVGAVPGRTTFQSVRSMATYIAPIAKMMWNQAYYGAASVSLVNERDERRGSYVITGTGTLVVASLAHGVVIVILVLFVECRSWDGAGAGMSME